MELLLPILIVGAIGLIAGVGLSIASVLMHVPTDETEQKIRAALPGANCGACGFSGCDGYAAAIAKGEAPPDRCAPGGAETATALSEILGVEVVAEQKHAAVLCGGDCDAVGTKLIYHGVQTCAAANQLYRGPSDCGYGCIGLGDCVRECEYDAISVKNGVAVVDPANCTGCERCVKACPKGIIALKPAQSHPVVRCSNPQKGAVVRKICQKGCIGCMKCAKVCPTGAASVKNFLASIDPALCTNCGACVEACPQHCID